MTENVNPENEIVEENDESTVEGIEEHTDPETPYRALATGGKTNRIYSGMWGPIEIAAVSAAAFVFVLSMLFYLLFVLPAQRELDAGRRHRAELDKELQSARGKWGDIQSTETQVARLLASVEDFESRALKDETIGRTAVYQRLNVLISSFDLRNTSGPEYVPLEISDGRNAAQRGNASKRGRDKYKSLFPGIFITTTVEGSYPNIRRFLREIETSQEFVAITSVELEPSDEETKGAETETIQVTDATGKKTTQRVRKGRYRGKLVNLRIEMAAYFRRPASQRPNNSVDDLPATPSEGGTGN